MSIAYHVTGNNSLISGVTKPGNPGTNNVLEFKLWLDKVGAKYLDTPGYEDGSLSFYFKNNSEIFTIWNI